jgi:hypothetical protein
LANHREKSDQEMADQELSGKKILPKSPKTTKV